MSKDTPAVRYLRSPAAIRERCRVLYDRARAGDSAHLRLDLEALAGAAALVLRVTREAYPTLEVPYHSRWRHFDVGGVERTHRFTAALGGAFRAEQGRARFELAIVSVLLDAGAGMAWRYKDATSGSVFGKSEGLAVASYTMFEAGLFSSDRTRPLMADAAGLAALDEARLARGFQVGEGNPLVGLKGRLELLHRLGARVAAAPEYFGGERPRLGNLYDYLEARAAGGTLPAREILAAVLGALGPIWPGRITLDGVNLGDVWRHQALAELTPGAGLVPFHKLSQWLTYSLVEPLEWAGVKVTGLDELTGLPEYRNGGLFLDSGVLQLKDADAAHRTHRPDSELIVEWRALTVILLDEIAALIRRDLKMTAETLPLAKVLQGGTWTAGRLLAKERRADGGPPLNLESDGTVF
jgi:hypothetical protein